VDKTFPARTKAKGGGFIVAGENYGQEARPILVRNLTKHRTFKVTQSSLRQQAMLLAGGLTRFLRRKWEAHRSPAPS